LPRGGISIKLNALKILEKKMTELQIKYKKIGDLIPYANNSRTHSEEQVTQIASSIKEFGWTNPVLLDGENGIIAGHGRVMAAKKLGYEEVPTIELAGLSEHQKKAYIIADNKLSLNAGWDEAILKLEIGELQDAGYDLSLTGFNDKELKQFTAEINEGLTDEDQVPEAPVEPKTKLGDIYILGNHRLMCGDSTSIDVVEKLLNGQRPDMVFTDPPYNIDYQGVKDKREKIKNDKMEDSAFKDFLIQSLYSCETMYVCCSWQYAHLFKEAMEIIGRKPKAMIVWDKVNPAQHLDKYFKQHEIIFYYGDFGGHKTLRGDVWTLKRQRNTVHPTMKPVELIQIALEDQPEKITVLDVFGGSGSTLIACEKLGRQARVMELDPKYCDVIVKRWEDFTGKKAELVNE
jgi:DNA modification methylase